MAEREARLTGKVATALADEYRLPVYPVSRVKNEVVETKFGNVRFIRGGLTAHHRDVLDVITTFAEEIVDIEGGVVDIVFDPAKISKVLGISSDWRSLRELLRDLKATTIQIKPAGSTGWGVEFSILDIVADTDTFAVRNDWEFKTTLKKITLSKTYVSLMQTEVALQLGPEVVRRVIGLRHQVSRSGARWLLSHTGDQHHKINDLLGYVGCMGSNAMLSKYRKQLSDDKHGLGEIGIRVDGKTIHYVRNKGVFITRGAAGQTNLTGIVNQNTPSMQGDSSFFQSGAQVVNQNTPSICTKGADVNQNTPSEQRGSLLFQSVDQFSNQNTPSICNIVVGVNQNTPSVNQIAAPVNQNTPLVNQNTPSLKGIVLKEVDLKESFKSCGSGDSGIPDLPTPEPIVGFVPTKYGLMEFRSAYERYFGSTLPGGVNALVSDMCFKYTIEEITHAFDEAALSNVSTLRYIDAVLKNRSKQIIRKKKTTEPKADGSNLQDSLEGYWQ